MQDLKLSIANLYPKELNLFSDSGNIVVLKERCSWHGINVDVDTVNIGDELTAHDLYFICGGNPEQQKKVSKDLVKKADFYRSEKENGKVFLGIDGGYRLLGKSYQSGNDEVLEALGLLDIYTVVGKKRFCGNVTAQTELISENILVGFENHDDLTYINGDTKPLAIVDIGFGNNGEDKTEGAYCKNVFGTYLHGPFLAQNPCFADYLIKLALQNKYNEEIYLSNLDDVIEIKNREVLINKSY